jgi:hypothetical protein
MTNFLRTPPTKPQNPIGEAALPPLEAFALSRVRL